MKYWFEVKTGDQSGAGTDSNIYVVLYGEYGQTAEVRLNGNISGNAFERNKKNDFKVDMSDDVGRIYKIDLRSDCKYSGSDWLLSYIKISRFGDPEKDYSSLPSTFYINKWINNQATKQFEVNYDDWKNVTKYETTQEKYKAYTLTVPPKSTFIYEKTETTTTQFFYKNVITKKTTTNFNTEMGSKSSFSATAGVAEGLSGTAASEKFLKFAFSKGFELSEMNEITRTENHTISETVRQELCNDSDQNQVYEAVFSLVKVNAISQMNSVIALFSATSEIVFTGFRLLPPQ